MLMNQQINAQIHLRTTFPACFRTMGGVKPLTDNENGIPSYCQISNRRDFCRLACGAYHIPA